jgi:beta-glucanase (GH16 family)
MWPAFWLLGESIDTVGWPACGEIDIMEGKGRLPGWTSGALNRGLDKEHVITTWDELIFDGDNFHDQWHVFELEWTPAKITWLVDGNPVMVVERPAPPEPVFWPYDRDEPYFLIFNLAVGGHFDAPHMPPADMQPQHLMVDWVRVYRDSTATAP